MGRKEGKLGLSEVRLDFKTNITNSPHVVVLGAGASLAAFPHGDRNGQELPLMQNLIETLNLKPIISKYKVHYQEENFELFYDNLVSSNQHPNLVKEIEVAVEEYFSWMRLPDKATIYDYLVLSLRPKDIIATFNWDPFLGQAFARNKNVIGYENMPQVVFLHGSVSIGVCYSCKTKGWRHNKCDSCGNFFTPSKLLYPISKKNYSKDPFLTSEWGKLQDFLQRSYLFTIFGYSAPTTDIEAKKLMLEVWKENPLRTLAEVEFINLTPKEELLKNWDEFITRNHASACNDFFSSQLSMYPRHSCEAFAESTLYNEPMEENRFPQNLSLKALQEWVMPLVEEEKAGKLSAKPNAR